MGLLDQTFDLFDRLGATATIGFPVIDASSLRGFSGLEVHGARR